MSHEKPIQVSWVKVRCLIHQTLPPSWKHRLFSLLIQHHLKHWEWEQGVYRSPLDYHAHLKNDTKRGPSARVSVYKEVGVRAGEIFSKLAIFLKVNWHYLAAGLLQSQHTNQAITYILTFWEKKKVYWTCASSLSNWLFHGYQFTVFHLFADCNHFFDVIY